MAFHLPVKAVIVGLKANISVVIHNKFDSRSLNIIDDAFYYPNNENRIFHTGGAWMMQTNSSGLRKFCLVILATITVIGMLLSLAQPVPVKAADPTPGPDDAQLAKSYKAASKPFLKLGEEMTYTIHLEIGDRKSVV